MSKILLWKFWKWKSEAEKFQVLLDCSKKLHSRDIVKLEKLQFENVTLKGNVAFLKDQLRVKNRPAPSVSARKYKA